MTRECGTCTLCCKLLPVLELKKPANALCVHQTLRKGCSIYAKRPLSCTVWRCKWLGFPEAISMKRPDKAHYVLDGTPDFITVLHNATQERVTLKVLQIWVDPKHKDAHRDLALREYLLGQAQDNTLGLVRFNSTDAITLIPPTMNSTRQWLEHQGEATKEHSPNDIKAALGFTTHYSNPTIKFI
jgi:hypothetical protein